MKTSNDLFQLYFTNKNTKNWMCKIDDYFLQSTVSYFGLDKYIDNYRHVSHAIRGTNYDISTFKPASIEALVANCEILYGLLHARYILTEDGMAEMKSRYTQGVYGKCPRYECEGQHLIPCGIDSTPGKYRAMTYCPKCHDIYKAENRYDGAFFGPEFPSMWHLMQKIPFNLGFKTFVFPKPRNEDDDEMPEGVHRWGVEPSE